MSAESTPAPASEASDCVELAGLRFHRIDEDTCALHVVERCAAGYGGWLVTPNLEILRQATTDAEIRALVESADLCVADGMPLIWASRLQGDPLPGRVCGSNLISKLPALAAERGLSIYLLGGDGDAAMRAAAILERRHPRLRVVGTWYPPFGFEKHPEEIEAMAEAVAEAEPDIVFFALPFPKGEHLLQKIRHVRPDAWWVGVGVSLSFLCGDVKRAPRLMQRLGAEWLHRMFQEPGKLVRRYLLLGLPFAARLLAEALRRRAMRAG